VYCFWIVSSKLVLKLETLCYYRPFNARYLWWFHYFRLWPASNSRAGKLGKCFLQLLWLNYLIENRAWQRAWFRYLIFPFSAYINECSCFRWPHLERQRLLRWKIELRRRRQTYPADRGVSWSCGRPEEGRYLANGELLHSGKGHFNYDLSLFYRLRRFIFDEFGVVSYRILFKLKLKWFISY